MFAKTIIDSDAFLDMPQSSQLLYFHLSMRADDDGFINNPKSITRNVKCNDDDLKLLTMKKFIIPFESGVVVIKHWKIHNYIRNDRYKLTKYRSELNTLKLDENNSYTIKNSEDTGVYSLGIPDDNQMDTQVRLGKDRLELGKDNNNITENEREVLSLIKKIENYPYNYETDLTLIRTITVDFPNVNIIEKIKEWKTWLLDHPLKEKSNPRLQIRNWLKPKSWQKGGTSYGADKKSTGTDEAKDYTSGKYGNFFK